jgi:RNA polymerase sigma-70 factor (ECF subfamily)
MSMRIEAAAANGPDPLISFRDEMNAVHHRSRYHGKEMLDVPSRENATARFYSLVWPHAQTVLRAAHYLMRDSAEAEDIAQETMIKAFKALVGFQGGTDMRAWLMTILRNTRIDHIRAAASSAGNVSLEQLGAEPADESDNAGFDDDPAWDNPDELLEGFSDHCVIEALRSLPEEIRWTLLLVDIEEMDHEDAASVLSVPVGTIKSRAFRGRAMLREALLPAVQAWR